MNTPTLTGIDRVVAAFRAKAKTPRPNESGPALQSLLKPDLENRAPLCGPSISLDGIGYTEEEFEALPH